MVYTLVLILLLRDLLLILKSVSSVSYFPPFPIERCPSTQLNEVDVSGLSRFRGMSKPIGLGCKGVGFIRV